MTQHHLSLLQTTDRNKEYEFDWSSSGRSDGLTYQFLGFIAQNWQEWNRHYLLVSKVSELALSCRRLRKI
jgi:hypothetical protein